MTGNKELNLRYLICIAGEYRTNGRGILSFIKSTNDESWNVSYFKQTSNFFTQEQGDSCLILELALMIWSSYSQKSGTDMQVETQAPGRSCKHCFFP